MKKMNVIRNIRGLALVVSFCVTASITQASDINFSGFLSVGGGMVDDDEGPSYGSYDEEDLTFDKNLLGIQVSGAVSDRLTATVQLSSRSENDYQVEAEWAYLSWQATENSKVRAGRLRTPYYMYSDFLDVGYSYAWINPPQSVYFFALRDINGVDFYSTSTLGIFDTSFQIYFGGTDLESQLGGTTVAGKSRNQVGVAGTLGRDWWTLRASYHQNETTIDLTNAPLGGGQTFGGFADALSSMGFSDNANNFLIDNDKSVFKELGLTVDTGTFVAALEYIEANVEDTFLSKDVRHYAMGGVRFGDWLFHVTASQTKDEAHHPEKGIPINPQTARLIGTLQAIAKSQVAESDVFTLGARWDVSNGAALKFQIDDIDDKTQGDQKVFSVALQTVF